MVNLGVRIPKSLHHAMKMHCVANRMQLGDFVIRALEERLAKKRAGKPPAPKQH